MVLPQPMRLRGYKSFEYMHKAGQRFNSPSLLIRAAAENQRLIRCQNSKQQSCSCKCAVSISNKVSKKSVARNRLRRILHAHLRKRLYQKSEYSKSWLLLTLKPSSLQLDPKDLLKECDYLLSKAGFFQ